VFGHVLPRVASAGPDKESMMLKLEIASQYTAPPHFRTTLWHCGRCDAFISIRSAQLLEEAPCPVCGEVVLEFCGKISSMPWIQFGDA
jgi:DNA-directed RNA polymerase subunit RPC12/RpoP